MRREFFYCFTLLFMAHLTYANTERYAANLYADFLIERFDKSLEDTLNTEPLDSPLYDKIMASRVFLESRGLEIDDLHENSLIKLTDMKLYVEVKNAIDEIAKSIAYKRINKKQKNSDKPLIFPGPGPEGNLSGRKYPANTWSLTYDDGPRRGVTDAIVDLLYQYGYRASFFMVMQQVKYHKAQARYVLANNMELALHSYTHKNLNKQSMQTNEYEVTQALRDLEGFSKLKIDLFRLPYAAGMSNQKLRELIAKNNLIHIFWNVDTLDWKDKKPESIFKRVLKQMSKASNGGGIILAHDIHKQTIKASKLILDHFHDNQMNVCTVGEMVRYLNRVELKPDCLKE